MLVAALVNAHHGHGCGQGGHQCGVYQPQGNLATLAAGAALVTVAAYGIFCRCVLCVHGVLTRLCPRFYKNGCFSQKKCRITDFFACHDT